MPSKPATLSEFLEVEITGIHARYLNVRNFHNVLVHAKHPQVKTCWRMQEPIAGRRMEASRYDILVILDYINEFCECPSVQEQEMMDFIYDETVRLAHDFTLDLSKYLEVHITGQDQYFGYKHVRIKSTTKDCQWEMREPIWSEWMQCDAGVFQSIHDYLRILHWCEAMSEDINQFIRDAIKGS